MIRRYRRALDQSREKRSCVPDRPSLSLRRLLLPWRLRKRGRFARKVEKAAIERAWQELGLREDVPAKSDCEDRAGV